MRAFALPLALLTLAGCRGLEPLRPGEFLNFRGIPPAPEGPFVRLKVRIDINSPSFAGVFDGVVIARTGPAPAVRAQFFPDVGGKALDLLARPDRITGHFPMSGEGIDIALPDGARIHLISLIGVTLLEHAAPLDETRVRGRRGSEIEAAGVAPGVTVRLEQGGIGLVKRHYEWLHGVTWTETATPDRIRIGSPRMTAGIDILKRERLDKAPDSLFELKLPDEVKR